MTPDFQTLLQMLVPPALIIGGIVFRGWHIDARERRYQRVARVREAILREHFHNPHNHIP